MLHKPPQRDCIRCGVPLTPGVPIKPNAGTLHGCERCGVLYIVREMGEMTWREDRADPDEWGHAA